MKKKAEVDTANIISVVILVIIGVVFLAVIAELISNNTEAQSVNGEAVTTSNVTAVSLDNPDLATNASCGLTPYTTDLTAGTILWSNTHPSNATTCNYTYYAPTYLSSATSRTITGVITILFAVLILIAITMAIKFR